jgi:hypothetical protein
MSTSNTLRFAGDVSINKVKVVSSSGFHQDIANQVKGIQIFEDLLSPFITGSLIIKDSLDLINLFPFVGEEFLELDISTPTLKQGNIIGKFYIYKMTDRDFIGDKSVVYQLHFTSQESLIDLNKSISKSFSGKVSDIVTRFLTDKTIGLQVTNKPIVEETSNETKYISNFWSPIKNIIYLTESATTKSGSPSYVFFENRSGYNFVSLESLYAKPVTQTFIKDNYVRDSRGSSGSVKNIQEDYKRITNIKVPVGIDYIDRIQSGAYSSKMYTYDLATKQVSSKNFSASEAFPNRKHLNEFPAYSKKVIYRYGSKILNEFKYYNNFSNFGDATNTKFIQERISLLKQAESTKIEITVPGRCDYTVGQKVELKLYKAEPLNKNDKNVLDNMFSGNYIISAINHQISKEMHECSMELIKDSLLVNLDGKKK